MKPILFNTEMVKAILEGRKTVTRRILKGFIPEAAKFGYTAFTPENSISCRGIFGEIGHESEQYGEKFIKLPYKVGDILYVRETWQIVNDAGERRIVYKANNDINIFGNWRPSIHMPKEAARIFLKVTDVRVERLQNITREDCKKEGIKQRSGSGVYDCGLSKYYSTAIQAFENLWNNTIKKQDLDKYGWEANPWVWVIEFKKCEKPEEVKGIDRQRNMF